MSAHLFLTTTTRLKAMFAALICLSLLAGIALPAAASLADPVDSQRYLAYDGHQRRYLLHLPPLYDGKTPLPLVIVLHGKASSAEEIRKASGFNNVADREGFLVAYPQALGNPAIWNTGINAETPIETDDVGFLRMVVQDVRFNFAVDEQKIYLSGHSSGAIMTYRAGSELGSTFAAIAPVAGASGIYLPNGSKREVLQPGAPLAVLAIHGEKDGMTAFTSDDPQKVFLPVSDALHFWVGNNHCTREAQRTSKLGGRLAVESYTGCQFGADVTLMVVKGAEHPWPTRENSGVEASELIWSFFAAH